MGRLDEKVILISGGAKGQGATESIMFAGEGAKIIIGDILDDEGLKVESQIIYLRCASRKGNDRGWGD